MNALLPLELVDQEPRLLSELGMGEEGRVVFNDMKVAPDRSCVLRADAKLREAGSCNTIGVRRDESGFHVVIPSNRKYRPRAYPVMPDEKCFPVTSITIGPPD